MGMEEQEKSRGGKGKKEKEKERRGEGRASSHPPRNQHELGSIWAVTSEPGWAPCKLCCPFSTSASPQPFLVPYPMPLPAPPRSPTFAT